MLGKYERSLESGGALLERHYDSCGPRGVPWDRTSQHRATTPCASISFVISTREIANHVQMVELPAGTGMVDTGCHSAVGGKSLHLNQQETMDGSSWSDKKVRHVAHHQFGPREPINFFQRQLGFIKLEHRDW